jgi:hypothetical protein
MPPPCTRRALPLLATLAAALAAGCDTFTEPRRALAPAVEARRAPDEQGYDRRWARWMLGNPVSQDLLQRAGPLLAVADGRTATLAAFVIERRLLRATGVPGARWDSHCRITHWLHAIRGDSTTPYEPHQPIPDEGLVLMGAEWPGAVAKIPLRPYCVDRDNAPLPETDGPWLHYLPPEDGALGWYGVEGTAHVAEVAVGGPCDDRETFQALQGFGWPVEPEFLTCRRARFQVRVDAELVARRSAWDSIPRETSFFLRERRHTLHVAPTVVPGFVHTVDCVKREAWRAAQRAAGSPPVRTVHACNAD